MSPPHLIALRASCLFLLLISSVLSRPTGTEVSLSVSGTNIPPTASSFPVVDSSQEQTESRIAAERDGSSGAVISAASLGSVALVVVACGGCFFLGRRRKRPGFHMPSVLVDIDTAREGPDTPSSSPTSVRPPTWRDSATNSIPPPESHEDSTHEQSSTEVSSSSRPPSYWSGKDPLYPPRPSSRNYVYG